jgi:ATP:ADP antiporter, AAA family
LLPLFGAGFGLAINFTDILWKSMVKEYYPSTMDYQSFMGNYSTVVG